MEKKLLIATDAFVPDFAPRMGYLVRYLQEMGWSVSVVAEETTKTHWDFLCGETVVRWVRPYGEIRGRKMNRLRYAGVKFLSLLGVDVKNRLARRLIAEELDRTGARVILASGYRTFPMEAVRRVAAARGVRWIADLRDIVEEYEDGEFLRYGVPQRMPFRQYIIGWAMCRLARQRNNAIKDADRITTVARFQQKILNEGLGRDDVKVIYNGFCPELFYPNPRKTEVFTLRYMGRLISGRMRKPDLLFKALREMADAGEIVPGDLVSEWYVDEESMTEIAAIGQAYGVSDWMKIYPMRPAREMPELMNGTDVLVMLIGGNARGVLGTKMYEYMAVGRPVLCVPSDGDEVEDALRRTRTGLAAYTTAEVKAFLREKRAEWQRTGLTRTDADNEALKWFSRRVQAGQFAALLEELTGKTE